MAGPLGRPRLRACPYAGMHALFKCPPPPLPPQVLTTPDAQRSFLAFFDASPMRLTPQLVSAVSAANLLVLEG